MKEALGMVGLIFLMVVLIGIGPILTLMSINTLFGLNIAYNLATWASAAWLCLLLGNAAVKKSK